MGLNLKVLLGTLFFVGGLQASTVDVLDPVVLESLDKPGLYSFATVLGEGSLEQTFLDTNRNSSELKYLNRLRLSEFNSSNNSSYQFLKDTLTNDVLEIVKLSGEKMAYSSENAEVLFPGGNGARHFDYNWLKSKHAAFPLIAVVNRIDKKDFYPDTCGELRFIYRLTYYRNDLGDSRSTLPLFMNVVYDYKKEGANCAEVAKLWEKTSDLQSLLTNPLNKKNIVLKQIELNMQVVRYPSGQKTDFGGQAIYLFRIFEPKNNTLVSLPLENTPDVSAITSSPELKNDLIKQITDTENLKKIDQGVFVLKNTNGKMLATRALSFSTNGRGRLANKPYSAIFNKNLVPVKDIPYNNLKFIKSPNGLMERLNNNTCVGCHQTSGTAGFHMLGYAGKFNSPFNKVVLPFSPHYGAEQKRREAYTQNLIQEKEANTFRPPSFYPAANWAGSGLEFEKAKARDLCLSDSSHYGLTFSCAKGSVCKNTVVNKELDLTIGECVRTPNVIAGHVCRVGVVTTSEFNMDFGDLFNLKSGRDSLNNSTVFKDTARGCGNPNGGVPLGRISTACDSNTPEGRLEFADRLGKEPLPEEMCAMRGGPQFDECAKSKNPPDCLAKAKIARGFLDTCSPGNFCREDYICQELPQAVAGLYQGAEKQLIQERIKKLAQNQIGFCVPNYFIFNMRTDGHIIPER